MIDDQIFQPNIIFLGINFKSSYSDTLNCSFDDYSRTTYKTSTAKSWVPPSQTHIITNNSIRWTEKGVTGQITENTNEKIKWNYKARRKTSSGNTNRTEWRFIFFKSNNKASADVIFQLIEIQTIYGEHVLYQQYLHQEAIIFQPLIHKPLQIEYQTRQYVIQLLKVTRINHGEPTIIQKNTLKKRNVED